jgi:hypothetical protein
MAHTMFLTRGIYEEVEKFIKELHTRYVPYKQYNAQTKEMVNMNIQLRLSPVQLWDLSYPKDQRDIIHATIFDNDHGGQPNNKRENKFVWLCRKLFRLLPIPSYKRDFRLLMRPPQHINLIGLGIKDDKWIEPDGRQVHESEKSKFATEGI